jgi:hypothetical protein
MQRENEYSASMVARLELIQGGGYIAPRRRGASDEDHSGSEMATDNSAGRAHPSLPTPARVVIVCGGVIGYSVAYHLTKLGGNRRFKLRFQHYR